MVMISVILPTYNEIATGLLPETIKSLQEMSRDILGGVELIAVDSGSDDGTIELLQESHFRLIQVDGGSRALRLNTGISASAGNILLLHHPRTLLGAGALKQLVENCDSGSWGGFTHCFDHDHWLLRFTSWHSNFVRLRRGIIYLDHCIFLHRSLLGSSDLLPDVEIFEDTELSLILLARAGKPRRLQATAQTSAIRFLKNGVIRQALMNQALKLAYLLRLPHRKMNRIYEKDLDLNGRT